MRITKAKCNTVASYHNWDVLNIFFAWINFKPQCITGKQVEPHFIIIIIEIQCIRECVCERHNRKFLKYQNKKWDDFTFIFCNGMCTACAIIISWSEMWKRKIFNMCILLRERCLAIFFSLLFRAMINHFNEESLIIFTFHYWENMVKLLYLKYH